MQSAGHAGGGLRLRFWGVRGSVAVPGRSTVRYGGNTACVEVRCGREIVILDAGTGIRELGKRLARDPAKRAARIWILITHTHWDHIQGFPFFAPAYLARQRIRILGGPGSQAGLQRTVAAAMESPFFPVALPQMPGTITVDELNGVAFRVGSLRGRTARLNHPGGGVAFRLDGSTGSLAYVPDHEVPCPMAKGPGPVTMSGNGFREEDMRALIRGVDVLIHDAQYTSAEYRNRVGWGHSCVDAVVEEAAHSGVRRLVLFHHDPDRSDTRLDAILARARRRVERMGAPLRVDAAREGMEIEIGGRST